MQHRRASHSPAPEPAVPGVHPMQRNPVQAKLFRGLADPGRLAILARLDGGSCSAGQLAVECGLTASNASNHLRCLLGCGLVSIERRGRRRVYSLTDPRVGQMIRLSGELLDSPVGELIGCCGNYVAAADQHRRAERSLAGASRTVRERLRSGAESTAGGPSSGRRIPKGRPAT